MPVCMTGHVCCTFSERFSSIHGDLICDFSTKRYKKELNDFNKLVKKHLELTTKLSLRRIRFLVMNIAETQIQDRVTKEVFAFRSPTKDILDTPLAKLISKWNLLPCRINIGVCRLGFIL